MKLLIREKFKLFQRENGVSLIEILVGVAILSTVGVAFLNGLFTTSKAVALSQESVHEESLARSQTDYIKTQDYILVSDYDPVTNCYDLIDVPAAFAAAGYSVEIDPPVVIVSQSEGGFELQSITVVIKRDGEKTFTISFYRVEG